MSKQYDLVPSINSKGQPILVHPLQAHPDECRKAFANRAIKQILEGLSKQANLQDRKKEKESD
jgi:hypothetical protein